MGLPKKESMTKDYCCCNSYLRSASDLNQYQHQDKRRKVTSSPFVSNFNMIRNKKNPKISSNVSYKHNELQ